MRALLLFLAVILAGCAGMSENECRSANWYELGERDGLYGNLPRIDTYAFQCERHNAQAAREQYLEGWWIGNATYRDRTAGSESS
jgi:hypothetical protein